MQDYISIIPLTLFLASACGSAVPGSELVGPEPQPLEWPSTTYEATLPCPYCGFLSPTDVENYYGKVYRAADAEFSDWGSGVVKMSCTAGAISNSVDLGLHPNSLADGINLVKTDIPVVDYASGNVSCAIIVDTPAQNANIDVLTE